MNVNMGNKNLRKKVTLSVAPSFDATTALNYIEECTGGLKPPVTFLRPLLPLTATALPQGDTENFMGSPNLIIVREVLL